MKRLIVFLIFGICFSAVQVQAARSTFSWDANTEPDLAGYRLFYRMHGQTYDYTVPIWEGTGETCVVDVASDGYFVLRAYDASGNESGDSNEVFEGSITPPENPKNLIRQAIQAMIDGLHKLDRAVAQADWIHDVVREERQRCWDRASPLR